MQKIKNLRKARSESDDGRDGWMAGSQMADRCAGRDRARRSGGGGGGSSKVQDELDLIDVIGQQRAM